MHSESSKSKATHSRAASTKTEGEANYRKQQLVQNENHLKRGSKKDFNVIFY
jgi:hypothetical protein